MGEVPRSERIESATPMATRMSPIVAIAYLVRTLTNLLFILYQFSPQRCIFFYKCQTTVVFYVSLQVRIYIIKYEEICIGAVALRGSSLWIPG